MQSNSITKDNLCKITLWVHKGQYIRGLGRGCLCYRPWWGTFCEMHIALGRSKALLHLHLRNICSKMLLIKALISKYKTKLSRISHYFHWWLLERSSRGPSVRPLPEGRFGRLERVVIYVAHRLTNAIMELSINRFLPPSSSQSTLWDSHKHARARERNYSSRQMSLIQRVSAASS